LANETFNHVNASNELRSFSRFCSTKYVIFLAIPSIYLGFEFWLFSEISIDM